LLKLTEKKTKTHLMSAVDKLKPEVEAFVNLVILDILLGADFSDADVRNEKLEHLQNV